MRYLILLVCLFIGCSNIAKEYIYYSNKSGVPLVADFYYNNKNYFVSQSNYVFEFNSDYSVNFYLSSSNTNIMIKNITSTTNIEIK